MFNLYKKDGTKLISEVASPIHINSLIPETTYAAGDYLVSASDPERPQDGESEKVELPSFTTKPTAEV